jgi:uncharacterized protein (TIGR02996 family)
MSLLESFLRGIAAEPWAEHRWLVLCDWLEENDDPRRAELLRLHRRLLTTCCVPDEHAERATWQSRVVELLGQGVRPCVPRQTVALAEGVGMAFSFIPPGPQGGEHVRLDLLQAEEVGVEAGDVPHQGGHPMVGVQQFRGHGGVVAPAQVGGGQRVVGRGREGHPVVSLLPTPG